MLAELAAAVRERRVSSAELVRLALDRITALDPPLGAVVARREDEAIAEATALTERLAAGEDLGPLAGLPLLVKDNEDLTGMRTTHGSLTLSEAPPATGDSLVVERLRAAGAVPVAKTNVPEFSFQGYTSNRLFGPTRNPWAPEWSPGGSSGGSGAALAAGMAAIATASDGGGSIRIPAGFCGLAGLKPTNGLIGRRPIPPWIDFSTKGPLATSIADVRLLLQTIAGPAAGDPTALPAWIPDPGRTMKRRILATTRIVPSGPLPASIQELFDAALRSLEGDLGFEVVPIGAEGVLSGGLDEDWFTMAAAEHAQAVGAAGVDANADRYTPEFLEAMRIGLAYSIEDYLAARRRRFDYVRAMDDLLGPDGVLVTPTMTLEGWSAEGVVPGNELPGTPGDAYNCQAANVTGHPALSVPAGRSPNGVPFGLMFTGPRFRDDLVLAIGAEWERANPWPLAAPGFAPFDADVLR